MQWTWAASLTLEKPNKNIYDMNQHRCLVTRKQVVGHLISRDEIARGTKKLYKDCVNPHRRDTHWAINAYASSTLSAENNPRLLHMLT